MLIPKNIKKEVVHNPFRPKVGIKREGKTRCKLSWGTLHTDEDAFEDRIRVDADHVDAFVEALDTIPKDEIFRCGDHEVWLIDDKWKKTLLQWAEEHFDEVIRELRKWD